LRFPFALRFFIIDEKKGDVKNGVILDFQKDPPPALTGFDNIHFSKRRRATILVPKMRAGKEFLISHSPRV